MNDEEPRYTKAEWERITINKHLVNSIHRALIGFRIRDKETFWKAVQELIHVSDVDLYTEIEEHLIRLKEALE